MNRRGFALVAAVWLLTALSVTVAGVMELARQGRRAALNRISLARGHWSGEACEAILRARFAAKPLTRSTDTVDLGRGAWCIATLQDPQALLNLNTADATTLRAVLGSDSMVAAILDWRDADSLPRTFGAERAWYRQQRRALPRDSAFTSVRELRLVRGLEHVQEDQLDRVFTVAGSGQVNLNVAPIVVLAALPALDAELVAFIERRRASGQRLQSSDEFLTALDPASRTRLAMRGGLSPSAVTFESNRLLLTVRGGVSGSPAVFRTTIEVVPSAGRLAVISRGLE